MTASHEGYVAESRLVTLEGNVTGVDFELTPTAGMITGVVTSVGGRKGRVDPPRGPLRGASVVVSREDLSFQTESSSKGDIGRFRIDDLPPGTYRVEFSRFDHRAVSKLVTVAAGKERKLGRIPLQFEPRRGVDEEGSLRVNVVDGRQNALVGAEVTITDVGTGEEVEQRTLKKESARVFDMKVGTYEVKGTKVGFRADVELVSVGPIAQEGVTLVLLERGQAQGTVVDSLTGRSLDRYQITIRTVLANGSPGDAVGAPIDPKSDGKGGFFWETPAQSLRDGRYVVEVSDDPEGYRVAREDQVLMEGMGPMRFRIGQGQLEVDLAPIEADELPDLTGQVLTPTLTSPDAVSFIAINHDGMTVDLKCPDQDPQGGIETNGENDDDPRFDAYSFTPDIVDAALGRGVDRATCTLIFAAPGYVGSIKTEQEERKKTLETDLLVEPTDGARDPDIRLDVALFTPRQVAGYTFWNDMGRGGMDMLASAINVRSTGRVITGFGPARGTVDPPVDPPPPPAVFSDRPVSADTADDPPDPPEERTGQAPWMFGSPRQAFGRMTYVLADIVSASDDKRFTDRQIAITVDEDGPSAALVTPGDELELEPDTMEVELDAAGGTIVGTLELLSTTPDLAGFTMDLTWADDSSTLVERVEVDSTGRASATTEDPGSYHATFTPPAPEHYVYEPVSLFQSPGQNELPFSQEVIELAQIDVKVVDGLGNTIPNAAVTVAHEHVPPPPAGDPASSSERRITGGDGVARFENRLVNTDDPVGRPVLYTATVADVPDHDSTDNSDTTTVVAGQAPPEPEPSVTITLPKYGSITGTVVGQVPGETNTRLLGPARGPPPSEPDGPDEVVITARRQYLLDGTPLPTPGAPLPVEAVGPNGFLLSGPPGWYTIDVSHEDYDPGTAPDPRLPDQPDDVDGLQVYRMTNLDNRPPDQYPDVENAVGQWVLAAKPGILDITVHEDKLSGPGVSGARITVAPVNGPSQPCDLTSTLVTNVNGHIVVDDLPQGNHVLTICERDAADDDLSFPVIVTVNIPFGNGENARTRVVHAPLARIGGEIVGEIIAQNSEQDRLPVPTLEVSRDYTPEEVQVGPHPNVPGTTDLVDNVATETSLNRAPGESPSPTAEPEEDDDGDGDPRYEFLNLATGAHVLRFPVVTGYTRTPTELTPEVLSLTEETEVDPVTYTADDRTVIVHVTTGGMAVDDATVTLTHRGR